MYGASEVVYYLEAEHRIEQFTDQGLAELPVCMAKTPLSLSADPKLLGAPTGFQLPVRDVRAYTGAGWLVPLCGDIQQMPGLGAQRRRVRGRHRRRGPDGGPVLRRQRAGSLRRMAGLADQPIAAALAAIGARGEAPAAGVACALAGAAAAALVELTAALAADRVEAEGAGTAAEARLRALGSRAGELRASAAGRRRRRRGRLRAGDAGGATTPSAPRPSSGPASRRC